MIRPVLTLLLLATPLLAGTEKAVEYANQGFRLLKTGKADDAVTKFRKALKQDPKLYVAHYGLGQAAATKKDYAGAAKHFRTTIRLKPDFAQAYNALGVVLFADNQRTDAIKAYEKALRIDPKYTAARIDLAAALRAEKRVDEARAALRKAIELDPKAAVAHFELARIHIGRKEADEALAELNQAIAIDPKFASAWQAKGAIFIKLGRLDDALAALKTAVKLAPKDLRHRVLLGHAYSLRREYAEAVKVFRHLTEKMPKSAAFAEKLGITLLILFERDGDRRHLDECIAALQRARKLDPKRENVQKYLDRALKRRGETE